MSNNEYSILKSQAVARITNREPGITFDVQGVTEARPSGRKFTGLTKTRVCPYQSSLMINKTETSDRNQMIRWLSAINFPSLMIKVMSYFL